MINILLNRYVHILLRLVMGGIIIYAGYVKLLRPDRFAEQIMVYDILPWSLVNIFTFWLISLELITGTMLILGIWIRANALLLMGLIFVFAVAISSALLRGISLHCGCFSTASGGPARTWSSLWQEGVIFLGYFWLWITTFRPNESKTRPNESKTPPSRTSTNQVFKSQRSAAP